MNIQKTPNYPNGRVVTGKSWPCLQAGFTIIEIILVVFLVGVLSLVVAKLLSGQEKIYQTQNMELGVTDDARSALDDIDSYVRMADALVASHDIYTLGSQTLILQILSINGLNQIIPATFDYVIFDLDGTKINRIIVPNVASARLGSTKSLAFRVSSLTFTYDNANPSLVKNVTTDLTTQETYVGIPTRSIQLTSRSKLRNN
jgi:prepilin-type N-terminal cleavage/methylation domain-containing protein